VAAATSTGLKNVSLAFGNKVIFRDASIQVSAGEKVCITGPSGSGKTTLLHLLMGFVIPDGGEVEVLGIPLSSGSIRRIRGQLSWLPQELRLEAETGRDLLLAPFRLKANRAAHPSEEQIEGLLGRLLLGRELLEQPSDTLSGGQKQRLALASCLLLGKPLLLLDEPTSALDDDAVKAVAGVVAQAEGVTLITVSHDERWLDQMERLIPLSNGDS